MFFWRKQLKALHVQPQALNARASVLLFAMPLAAQTRVQNMLESILLKP